MLPLYFWLPANRGAEAERACTPPSFFIKKIKLWLNIFNIKFLFLTIFKCAAQWH